MKQPHLLFLGDSLIDYGQWSLRFPHNRVTSLGVPGELVEGLLHRLPSSLRNGRPDAIIIMSGTNNLFFGTRDFSDSYHSVITHLAQCFSNARIIITSLLPYRVGGLQTTIEQTNEELKCLAEQTGVHYHDVYLPFSLSSGDLFTFDGVHLSETGYDLWAHELKQFLNNLLAPRSI